MRIALTAIMAIAVPLIGGACGQEAVREPAQCSGARDCWTVTFAFINFTGERAELYIDDERVLDAHLKTADWTNTMSRSLTHPVTGSSEIKLRISGAAVYQGPVAGADVRTIYIDARSATPVEQTDHPGPLLD